MADHVIMIIWILFSYQSNSVPRIKEFLVIPEYQEPTNHVSTFRFSRHGGAPFSCGILCPQGRVVALSDALVAT